MDFESEWDYIVHIDNSFLFREIVTNLTHLPDDVLIYHFKRLTNLTADSHAQEDRYDSRYKPFVSLQKPVL